MAHRIVDGNVVGSRIQPQERPKLWFHNYLTPTLPPPPDTVDYSASAASVLANVYLNDQLGDCVIAGYYHVKGVLTGGAGDLFTATPTQIKDDYTTICGPGDQGCDESATLDYWVKTGDQGGTKLLGYLGVDATNPTLLKQALYIFENLYFGVCLPDGWINPMPQQSGFTWDVSGSPDPGNGHCICGVAYNSVGVKIATWGMLGICTWAALAKYMITNAGGECYVLCSPDQLAKAQTKCPNGIDWPSIIADFNQLGGNLPIPPPIVPPVPPPVNPPTPGPFPNPAPDPDPLPPPAPVSTFILPHIWSN